MTKVLLITNDHYTKSVVDRTLTYNGYMVHLATQSSSAWRYLNEMRFDFVMIDMNLRNESGLAVYKSLRLLENNIPVMMIGEGTLDELILKDMALENYAYILKPFKLDQLKMKINSFLDKNYVSSYGELKIDKKQQLLIFKDKLVQLTKTELDILILLAQKGGEAIHPKTIRLILEKEGKFCAMTTFYFITKLRKKLLKYKEYNLNISFIKDQGYRLSYP